MRAQTTRTAIFIASMLALAIAAAEATTITLACKLKDPGKSDTESALSEKEMREVDQIAIDTIEKSFTLSVAKTKGTSKPTGWLFDDDALHDGCQHMTFSENGDNGDIIGVLSSTCGTSSVQAFIYDRKAKIFVYANVWSKLGSNSLQWQCAE